MITLKKILLHAYLLGTKIDEERKTIHVYCSNLLDTICGDQHSEALVLGKSLSRN
jgi:hypothetical protein